MTVKTAAPKTPTCGTKNAYRNETVALLIVATHDRASCARCRHGRVLAVYACLRHFHVGHRLLGGYA